jgi:hypothetical protein
MNPSHLIRYQPLYRASQYMGAARILRQFLGLAEDAPIPLTLSHGVDCAQYKNALEVESVEPLHWSYNRNIHETASRVKPSVMAPHAWAIVVNGKQSGTGSGVLLIGPPPSPENDERLYMLIANERLANWTVLVKARGEYEGSVRYWSNRGLRTITGGRPDDSFHERLFMMLSGFETVVGCSFSSALLFAASIGKQVILLRNYAWETYDASNFLSQIWLESPRARKIVRVFADGSAQEKTDAARELLGFDMLGRPGVVREALDAAIHSLKRPFHHHPDNPIPYRIREFLTIAFGKPGFLRYSSAELLAMMSRQQVGILRMNDIDAWLNGRNESNCSLTPVRFRKGVTQPGWAPRGYQPTP